MPASLLKLRHYVGLVTLLSCLLFGILFVLGMQTFNQIHADIAERLENQADLRLDMMQRDFTRSIQHSLFLYSTPPIAGIVRAAENNGFDPLEKTREALWKNRLQIIFKAYIENNSNIAQIRYIGEADNGRELVRVDQKSGQALVVPEANLQQKGQTAYFEKVRKLHAGQIYISNIDLNREHGKIEQPAWPTYRTGVPVFDDKGAFFGAVIINFYAAPRLQNLMSNLSEDETLFLLNAKGQYLIHPDPSKSFGFEFGDPDTWASDYREMSKTKAGKKILYAIDLHTRQKYFIVRREYRWHNDGNPNHFQLILAEDETAVNRLAIARIAGSSAVAIVFYLILLAFITFYWRLGQKRLIALQARANFDALIRASNDVIVSMDGEGRIETWNSAAQRVFGFPENYMFGKLFVDFIDDDDDRDVAINRLQDLDHAESFSPLNTQMLSYKGNAIDVAIIFSPIRLETGVVTGSAAIVRDIRETKKLQASLEALNVQLSEKNHELERFIYTVSHDLKSPLVTIDGFASNLIDSLKNSIDEKSQHRLRRIRENARELANMLSELLTVSRLMREEFETEACALGELGEHLSHSLELPLQKAGADIRVSNEDLLVPANKRLLIQALQNLLTNAIQYRDLSRPLKIEIGGESLRDEVRVFVRDNGIGIAPENQERILGLFERLNIGEGSGVGLAIVKTIMEKHQGKIDIQSSPGQGSCFTLIFPAKRI